MEIHRILGPILNNYKSAFHHAKDDFVKQIFVLS